MKLKEDTIKGVHEQMARVKAESTGGFCTNYFRQDMAGSKILSCTTARSVVLLNDEHDFFRLYFFTTDVADLEQILESAEFPGDTVTGYLTRSADKKVAEAFENSAFHPIATYRRMITYQLPAHRTNAALEYATAADVDQLHARLFESFDKYTDHLPTKDRLRRYVTNQWVIVHRNGDAITGAVCFQLEGSRVNYNYVYNLTGNAVDFLRLQSNFYGVMRERGISAGFLWVNEIENRLACLHQSMGWQFDGLKDHFYLRSQQ
jgi:hypothetical protein